MIEFLLSHPYLTIWTVLIILFERSTYCGYVVDDDTCFIRMKRLKEQLKDKKSKSISFYSNFIYTCMYGAGLFRNAVQEHLFTVLLHGINCSLIYAMSGSLFASFLYLINPINNQTVLWLNGRRYALSILAVLLAWNFWWTAPFMMAFCAWLHVSGVALPLLFMVTPFWPVSFFLSGLAVVLGHKRLSNTIKGRKSAFKNGNENQNITWKKAILYIKTIGYHFWNCVLPLKPAMYHEFLFYFSSTDQGTKEGYSLNFDFWKGIVTVALLGFLMISQHSFGAFWFVVFISQWCNIYQVTMNASDRYCSLANIGVMLIVSEMIMKLPSPYSWIVGAGLSVFYIVKYIPLFRAYRNIETFHQYHINQQPDTVNSRFFLSKIYIAKKDPYQAFAVIRQGLKYKPTDFKLLLAFVECLFALGKKKQALQAMEIAERNIPPLEVEDCKNLFEGIRMEYRKEYELLHDKVKGHNYIHNGGKPVIKQKAKEN